MRPKNHKHNCLWCGKEYDSSRQVPGTCSPACRIKNGNKQASDRRREVNNEKYRDVHDIPICKICGWKSRSLQAHIQNFHGMTLAEYKQQFSVLTSDIFHSSYTQDKRERVSGSNNPGYQHGGSMSTFSINNARYNGLSDEEKLQCIDAQIKKANNTKKQNNSYNTTLEFYIKKGYTPEEAGKMLSKRQRTFALDICIGKYGYDEGVKRWQERQTKWLDALSKLNDEEKIRIEKLKSEVFELTYSRVSVNLFESLNIQGALYGQHEVTLQTRTGQKIKPDFVYGNKVIEFYGDFWHANPAIYGPDDILKFPIGKGRYASKIALALWIKDEVRIKNLTDLGYKVLIIWERDYHKNPNECMKKCLEFLAN